MKGFRDGNALHEQGAVGTTQANKLHAHHTFRIALVQRLIANPPAIVNAIDRAFHRAIFGGARHG